MTGGGTREIEDHEVKSYMSDKMSISFWLIMWNFDATTTDRPTE
jgi:hypothetical protein